MKVEFEGDCRLIDSKEVVLRLEDKCPEFILYSV